MERMNKFEYALYLRRQQVREHRNRALEQQRKRMKKERRKDTIIFIVLVIGFITSLALAMKLGQDSMRDCINAGHSKNYCERGL